MNPPFSIFENKTSFWTIYVFVAFIALFACTNPDLSQENNWDTYLGDKGSRQFSALKQINTENVHMLEMAWTFSSMDADTNNRSQIQCNPLVVDGIVYGTSAQLKLYALDGSTGEEIWEFDPFDKNYGLMGMGVNRGLTWYEDISKRRIFFCAGSNIYSIDPDTGQPDHFFGDEGAVDMHKGLGRDVDDLFIVSNTPGIIYRDLLIMGSRVSESTGAAPGHIRAFDVHTGEQKWIFHTIPLPGEYGHDTWPEDAYKTMGGANVWAGFSLDEERGIVYCPTGSASFDFYGGDREGANLFANCILALNAGTGERIWHYQTIHHDIWDKDLPAPPNLVTINKDGKDIDAIAQITKNGFLFVLNRETGEALYPIEEIPVPRSTLIGEHSWPTQPVPTVYPAFSRVYLTEEDLAVRNDTASLFAQTIWSESNKGSPFVPPSREGTIIFPGFDGGGEWGGAAYDATERNLIVNSNEVMWRTIMDEVRPATPGQQIYEALCQNCHGQHLEGNQIYGNIPTLVNLKSRVSLKETQTIVMSGKGIMPGFSYLNAERIQGVYDFINGDEDESEKVMDPNWPYPYRMRGYEKLYAPDGYPMIKPPWGQLTSINMDRAEINWQVPLGEHEELTAKGMDITGTESYGGPVVTKGGLIFIAATMDEKIRAFDKNNGKELWESPLPAAGYATPAIYAVDGKQFVLIACGGGKLGTKSGDSYVAFSLKN